MKGLAEVLAEHRADGTDCACSEYVLDEPYRAHVEAVVLGWLRERLAGAREDVARALAELEPGEEWSTNAALGGGLTGTRDDEYRAAMQDDADAALAVVAEALGVGEVRG